MGRSASVSRICRIKRQRTTVNHSTMKLAISILFLATTSTGAPSMSLRRNMLIGHDETTLAENQKQTAMKIEYNIIPWIQDLEKILTLSIDRQYNETSQLHKYIEALEERIAYLKSDTNENLISLQTMTNWNDEKILEATVMNSMKHPDTSLNTDSAPASPPYSVPSVNLSSWSYKEPVLSTAYAETFSPPRRLPMISTTPTPVPHSTSTTPAPYSTKPPCIAGGLKNC